MIMSALVQTFLATTLVIGSQIPVLAYYAFLTMDLPLLGDVYDSATMPIVILCTFWILNGALGLNGPILVGFGKSSWILFNVLIAIGALIPLLYLWVPTPGSKVPHMPLVPPIPCKT